MNAQLLAERERLMAELDPRQNPERARFEAWYTTHAFDYAANPIGTRDCSLQWDAWKAAIAAPEAAVLDIDAAVNRFLCWKLPANFHPDAGISFTPYDPPEHPHMRDLCWPVGTNLLTADQARAMFTHCLAAPSKEAGAEPYAWGYTNITGDKGVSLQRWPHVVPGYTEHALIANPPGDQRQEGAKPARIEQDPDGNWIASPPPEAAAAVGEVIENGRATMKWLTSEAAARRGKDDFVAGCFVDAARYVNDLIAALASPTGVDEMLRDLAENGLRYSLTPCLDWTSKDTINAFWMDYMRQADRSIRERATAALAARDGGAKA